MTVPRDRLLDDVATLWAAHSDYRLGQVLRTAGAMAGPVEAMVTLSDEQLRDGLRVALDTLDGVTAASPTGPFWDTESATGRSFLDGLPRDPVRIAAVLDAVRRAWRRHPQRSLVEVLDLALARAGVEDNEFGTRILLVEDAPLRRYLLALVDADDTD